jgi:hypothetical protein
MNFKLFFSTPFFPKFFMNSFLEGNLQSLRKSFCVFIAFRCEVIGHFFTNLTLGRGCQGTKPAVGFQKKGSRFCPTKKIKNKKVKSTRYTYGMWAYFLSGRRYDKTDTVQRHPVIS